MNFVCQDMHLGMKIRAQAKWAPVTFIVEPAVAYQDDPDCKDERWRAVVVWWLPQNQTSDFQASPDTHYSKRKAEEEASRWHQLATRIYDHLWKDKL